MTNHPNRKGPFDIPRRPDQSTDGARRAFFAAFGLCVDATDVELRALARELDQSMTVTCLDYLTIMRERFPAQQSA
jgi:hypothetical protein